MAGAIGELNEEMVDAGASGSLTAKLRRMTFQLEQLIGIQGGTTSSSGSNRVQGFSLDGALVSGAPVLMGIQGRNLLVRVPHSLMASSGTVGPNVLATGPLVQDANGLFWPFRQASAVSGMVGIGLLAAGNVVQGADGIWWPLKGNNTAPYVQGPLAVSTAISGTNPLLMGVGDSSNTIAALRATTTGSDNVAPGTQNALIVAGLGYSMGVTNWERARSVTSASGTVGAGIPGTARMLLDPSSATYHPQRGRAGVFANAWSATSVSASGVSTAVDKLFLGRVAIYGNSSVTTNLSVEVSWDGSTFYRSPALAVIAVNTAAGHGEFYAEYTISARFVRLRSSASATITATIESVA